MTTSRRGLAVLLLLVASIAALGCTRFKERKLLNEGNKLFSAEKYELAIGKYAQILAIEPSNWDANYLTAVSYLKLYHPGSEHPKDKEYAVKGVAAFESTLALPPPSPEHLEKTERYYLGFLDSTGDKDKAIAYLEKQLAGRPSDLALINQIAALYQKKGDFTKSLEYFGKRASMDSNNKEAWYTLGVNCWARSYHGGATVSQEERHQVVDKGIEAFNKALAIDPEYFDALSYINLIYREKAKALAAEGKNVEAGEAYATADQYQKKALDIRKKQAAAAPKAG